MPLESDQVISCLLCPFPHLSFSHVKKKGDSNASSMKDNEVEYIKNAQRKLS